ncbi:MAG TPA: hypothetical protein VGL64_04225 [Amycolatopsis sp.]
MFLALLLGLRVRARLVLLLALVPVRLLPALARVVPLSADPALEFPAARTGAKPVVLPRALLTDLVLPTDLVLRRAQPRDLVL